MIRGLFIRKLKDFAEDSKELAENTTMLQRLKGDLGLPVSKSVEVSQDEKGLL